PSEARGVRVWPAILTAGVMSLANLTLLAPVAAGFVRYLLPAVRRVAARAPFWGAAVLGAALVPCWRPRWPRSPCGPARSCWPGCCGERVGEFHLREHSDRIQGRRCPGHRLHPTAETCWGRRGRRGLLSPHRPPRPATAGHKPLHAGHRRGGAGGAGR